MKHLYDNNLKQGVLEYSWSMEMEKATAEFQHVALPQMLPAKGMLDNAGKIMEQIRELTITKSFWNARGTTHDSRRL